MRRTLILVLVLAGCSGGNSGDDGINDDTDGAAPAFDAAAPGDATPPGDAAPGDAAPPGDVATDDASVTAMTVGADGGTLTTADGVVIEIPAGALPAATTITVRRAGPPAMGAVGPVYELGPDGTRFAQPVTLTLPYDPASLGGVAPGDLMLATRASGGWSSAGWALVDTGSRRVTGYITHFSTWAIIPSPQGSQCQLDYGCFQTCCGTQVPDLCCSANRDTCYCAHGRTFAGFVGCYADCVRTPQGSNFASSPCMSACCQAQGGTTRRGACMVADRSSAMAVLSCARSCTGPGDQMSTCQRGDITFDACSWNFTTPQVVGMECPNSGVNSQFLYSNFRTIFGQTWGAPPSVRVDSGNIGGGMLGAQLSCVGGGGSGSISATWSGTRFDGTWTFGPSSGPVVVTPNWRLSP